MGDIADMMLDGDLCEGCGVWMGDVGDGFPRRCSSCRSVDRHVEEAPRKSRPFPHQKATDPAHMRVLHECHWPGCGKQVPPNLWGCGTHWKRLPNELRGAIWRHYRPGQEIDKQPSAEYVRVAQEVQRWIAASAQGGREDGG